MATLDTVLKLVDTGFTASEIRALLGGTTNDETNTKTNAAVLRELPQAEQVNIPSDNSLLSETLSAQAPVLTNNNTNTTRHVDDIVSDMHVRADNTDSNITRTSTNTGTGTDTGTSTGSGTGSGTGIGSGTSTNTESVGGNVLSVEQAIEGLKIDFKNELDGLKKSFQLQNLTNSIMPTQSETAEDVLAGLMGAKKPEPYTP